MPTSRIDFSGSMPVPDDYAEAAKALEAFGDAIKAITEIIARHHGVVNHKMVPLRAPSAKKAAASEPTTEAA